MFTQTAPTNGSIIEAHYRTDQTDATHAIVYFWGTVQYEADGQMQTNAISRDNPESLPMVFQDGQWYIDTITMVQRAQQQSGTSQAQ
jgi:hypothetical protein